MYNDYAEELLKTFVTHFYHIYGIDMAVYNVHCLVHLAKDAKRYGSLEHISSFPFENFLSRLKRLVRKPDFPLQQVIRRLSEQKCVHNEPKTCPILKGVHLCGPLPDDLVTGTQYKHANVQNIHYKINRKDSCVRIRDDICLIQNIIEDEFEVFLVCKRFRKKEDFFVVPLRSSLLGILKISQLDDRTFVAKLDDVQAKCVLLPYQRYYIALPFSDANW